MPVSQSDDGVLTQDKCPVRLNEGKGYCPTCQDSGPAAAVGGCIFYLRQLNEQRAEAEAKRQRAEAEAKKCVAYADENY